jgi:predicted 3-demethylubiquinone-9 3-methyltransferase (glyoxalase superfamily)
MSSIKAQKITTFMMFEGKAEEALSFTTTSRQRLSGP